MKFKEIYNMIQAVVQYDTQYSQYKFQTEIQYASIQAARYIT